MADDVKLEILLQAKNQSESAFRELKNQLNGLQQDMAKTAKAAESSLSFDKFKAQIIGIGAAIYGAFKTVGTVIDQAEIGAKLQKQEQSFKNLASAAGTSSSMILDELRRVSQGMVSEADLIQASGKALLMGLPAAEIVKYMEIAAATSKTTGQTITEAFNDITIGVARQSRMILDNLGIIVSVEKANEDYAKALGKTAAALTDAEKRQAFANATLKAGEDMMRRIGTSAGSLDGATKATAEWSTAMDNLSKLIAEKSNPLFEAVSSVLHRINMELKAGRDAASEYTGSFDAVDSRISQLNKKYGDMERRKSWGYNEPQDVEYRELLKLRERYRTQGTNDFGRGNVAGRWGTMAPQYYGSIRASDNEIAYDPEGFKDYLSAQEKAAKAAKDAWDEFMRPSSAMSITEKWEDDADALDLLRQELIKTTSEAKQFNLELYKKASEGDLRRAEKEIPYLQKQGWDEGINDVVKSVETGFDFMIELSERTSERMQDNFSDLFFDAFRRELKSLNDYLNAVLQTMQRAMADMSGQVATQAIFGSKSVGGTSQSGGMLAALIDYFSNSSGPQELGQYSPSARGNVFDRSGLKRFAAGGVVTRPTVFPFANGTGLMGEAGPEGILPLKRMPSGKLGVESSGSDGGVNVIVNNYTGQEVQTKETRNPGGQRDIEVIIGQVLAKDGPATRVMRQRYGLTRRGIMR